MNIINRIALLTAVLAAALSTAMSATAATVHLDFANRSTVSALYFWALDSSTEFDKLWFREGMDDWSIVRLSPSVVVATGPQLAPEAGLYRLKIKYSRTPLAFEWAEVLFDGTHNHVKGSGTWTWDGHSLVADSRFTHLDAIPDLAPSTVPLPPAALLLMSGVGMLALVRRRAR